MKTAVKKCSHCGQAKDASEFNKNRARSDGLQTYCRNCQKERDRENYAKSAKRRKQIEMRRIVAKEKYKSEVYKFIANYLKDHPCIDCGESNPIVLQFDHVRDTKVAAISEMIHGHKPKSKIAAEIEKCEVRCANCHSRKTAIQFNYRTVAILKEIKNEHE